MTAVKKSIMDFIEGRQAELTAIAEELYRNPEVGLQEFRASAMLAELFEKNGFVVERGVAGLETAFRATFGTSGPGIAILAEMDALPVMGHACGHNIIAAAAAGAALALRHVLPPGVARIIVLGTPAEELGIGKVELINKGAFADVDFAMMVHPSSKRQVIKMYLGLARIRFAFTGVPAHAAAYPDEGINALDAVIQTFNSINALRQQLRPDVRVHGIITEGGVAPNIIPDRCGCYFYVRADDLHEVLEVRKRVIACAQGAALATGCRLQTEEDERVLAPLKVNRAFSDLYSTQLRYLGLKESNAPADKNKGSSDIGNVSQFVPTIHPHVPIGDGLHIHSEDFAKATVSVKGREAVLEGAKAMALTAAALVESSDMQLAVKKDFMLG